MNEDEVQRFEYMLWFEGDWVPPMDIADTIQKFVQSRGGIPLHAGYGTIEVPREDVGEYPTRDGELTIQIKEHLKFLIEEDLPNIRKEIEDAREQLAKDRKWYGPDADTGYLESVRQQYSQSMAVKKVLENLLGEKGEE